MLITDFCACPYNILSRETTRWIWVLVAYVALQVVILFLQDLLGPRFFVPERVSYSYPLGIHNNRRHWLVPAANI